MGAGMPVNTAFTLWPLDLNGTIAPYTSTVTLRLEVPTTGPCRIIWNRL